MSSDTRLPSTPPTTSPRPEAASFDRADRLPIGRFLVWFVAGLAVVLSLAALADDGAYSAPVATVERTAPVVIAPAERTR